MSADNVAGCCCGATAAGLWATIRAATDWYLLPTGPTAANPSPLSAAAGLDRQTDRRVDGRTDRLADARQLHSVPVVCVDVSLSSRISTELPC